MGTPHKHAEILKAIADGIEVQVLVSDCWKDIDVSSMDVNFDPLTNHENSWRIKPKEFVQYGLITPITYRIYSPLDVELLSLDRCNVKFVFNEHGELVESKVL